MKKGVIKLLRKEGGTLDCEADIMSEQWAIHQDPFLESKLYVLTHIPSGKRVWSSKTKTFLKRLIQEPAFFETLKDTDLRDVKRLGMAILDFCDRNTDLTAKPKKKIGWV